MSDSNEDSKTSDSSPGTPYSPTKVDSDVLQMILGRMKTTFNCGIKDTDSIDVDSQIVEEQNSFLITKDDSVLLEPPDSNPEQLTQITPDGDDKDKQMIVESLEVSVKKEHTESNDDTVANVPALDDVGNVMNETCLNVSDVEKSTDKKPLQSPTKETETKTSDTLTCSAVKTSPSTAPRERRSLRSQISARIEVEPAGVKRSARNRLKDLSGETVMQSAMARKEKQYSSLQKGDKTASRSQRLSTRLSPMGRLQHASRTISGDKSKSSPQKINKASQQSATVPQAKTADDSICKDSLEQQANGTVGYTKTGKRRYKPFRGLRYSLPSTATKKAKGQKRLNKSFHLEENIGSVDTLNMTIDILYEDVKVATEIKSEESVVGLDKSEENVVMNTEDASDTCLSASKSECQTGDEVDHHTGIKRTASDEERDNDEINKRSRMEHVPSPSPADCLPGPSKPESTAILSGAGTAALCCCQLKYNIVMDASTNTFCQAVDSVDEHHIGCNNVLMDEGEVQLRRPSPKCPFLMLCEVHHERFLRHNCCPGCGLFCTQGKFVLCPADHFYHRECSLHANGKEVCPHCGMDNPEKDFIISAKVEKTPLFLPSQKLPRQEPIAKMGSRGNILFRVENNNDVPLPSLSEYNIELPSGKELSSLGLPSLHSKEELEGLLRKVSTMFESDGRNSPSQKYTVKSLYNAAKTGNVEKLIAVLAFGVNPNHLFRDSQMQSALHITCSAGYLTMVHLLVMAGVGIDIADKDLNTPLMLAVLENKNDVVKYLIKAGACVTAKDANGMTALHLAAKTGNLEACHYLLSRSGCEKTYVDSKDDGEWTPLVWAAEHRHLDVVRYLLSRKADPQIRDSEQNDALHWAAYSGSEDIAEILLNLGAEVSSTNIHGDTPLHIAARENMYECVKLLLMRKARKDLKNSIGKIPLDCCVSDTSECYKIIKLNMLMEKKVASIAPFTTPRIISNDISRGREVQPIQCINEEDDEDNIGDFTYVTENCFRTDISISSTIFTMVSCDCTVNCEPGSCRCFTVSNGCWYDKNGRLRPDFNYSDPALLCECHQGCKCHQSTCCNRVVQNGITERLQLFRTKRKGWGVRTLQPIPKGTFVCEYVGEIITDTEANSRDDDTYFFDLENEEENKEEEEDDYCLDALKYGNVSRFINHMCEPNLSIVHAFYKQQDKNFPKIVFFACRDIDAYEELGYDYGFTYWAVKHTKMSCKCRSEKCRWSRGNKYETAAYVKKVEEENAANQV